MKRPELLGAVLVGGRSSRYGRPKWRVPVLDVPMVERVAGAARDIVRRVVAVGGDGEVEGLSGLPVLDDVHPGRGPLGGLHTALHHAAEEGLEGVLLLACDLPLVEARALGRLLAGRGGADAVVPRDASGAQPACAVYERSVLPEVEDLLGRTGAGLRDLLERLEVTWVPVSALEEAAGRPDVLLNVNTPEDRMRAEALLRSGPPLVCVVGKKDSGKTELTVRLIAELARRGRRVMSVKHGHAFELDKPGTDSWRHRHEGGALRVAMVGPEEVAVLGGWGPSGEPPLRTVVDRHLPDADIVVAEGWKAGPDPKIEVYRASAHPDPLYIPETPLGETFLAVVTDRSDYRPPGVAVLDLDDPELVPRLVRRIESVFLE